MRELRLMIPTYIGNVASHDINAPAMARSDNPTDVHAATLDAEGRVDPIVAEPESPAPQQVGPQTTVHERLDFGEPNVPVLIREGDGVRIVLGSHDYNDYTKPDVHIERRPYGWAMFLHPLGGCDPSGSVYFLDDGRSFLLRANDIRSTEVIEVLEANECVPGLDRPH